MSRQILCRKCGDDYKLHPEDRSRGIVMRKVFVSAVTPEGHDFKVNGVFTPLEHLHCDLCNETLEGDIVHAVSVWDSEKGIMSDWEKDYGAVLTPEAVAVADGLSKARSA